MTRYCVYCGRRLRDRRGRFTSQLVPVACWAHRDLLALDPNFTMRSPTLPDTPRSIAQTRGARGSRGGA